MGEPGSSSPPPRISFLTGALYEQASAGKATEELQFRELWPGSPSGVFQSPTAHCAPVAAAWAGEGLSFVFFPTEDEAKQCCVGTGQALKSL